MRKTRIGVRTSTVPIRPVGIVAVALALAACAANDLPPSIWPPPDFGCDVEEVQVRDGLAHVVRRVRVTADGLVVYGTAARSLVDDATGIALPVYDRLAIYRLVPTCLRALARRIDRLGVRELDPTQGERGTAADTGLVLRWRAFGGERTIVARGRASTAMAAILNVVSAHLPPGERFQLPGMDERPIVPVLRGVPEPLADGPAALQAYGPLLAARPDDQSWLLEAYALACATGARARAEQLLRSWVEASAAARATGSAFADGPPGERPAGLTDAVLRRLLPP